jgi:hypothetical protein
MKFFYLLLFFSLCENCRIVKAEDYDASPTYKMRTRVTIIYKKKEEKKAKEHFERIPSSEAVQLMYFVFFGYGSVYQKCNSGDIESFTYFVTMVSDRPVCSEKPFYALTQKDVQEKAQESKK